MKTAKILITLFFISLRVSAIDLNIIEINDRVLVNENFTKGQVFGHTVGNGFGLSIFNIEKSFTCESEDSNFKIYFYRDLGENQLFSIVRAEGVDHNVSEFLTIEELHRMGGDLHGTYAGVNAERKDFFHLELGKDGNGIYELITVNHRLTFKVFCHE